MKITILGCGSSGGVPLIGNDWGACDPNNPRNRRSRVSILVEQNDTVLLVDTSPDMRQQLLSAATKKISAVLYTHAHADHSHGIDDLRSVNWMMQKSIPVYADEATMKELEVKFSYVFSGSRVPGHFYKPSIIPTIIKGGFEIEGITIQPFKQDHGYGQTLGFRFGDFAYSTDVHSLDEAAFDALKGIKIWVVDCVREQPHPTHSHLAQTLDWIERVKPAAAYLTHMGQTLDYASLLAKLPAGVEPAYDGLILEC
jgi:phosphoribosyl 1,2-cyclic phosphate phosphodiesterase